MRDSVPGSCQALAKTFLFERAAQRTPGPKRGTKRLKNEYPCLNLEVRYRRSVSQHSSSSRVSCCDSPCILRCKNNAPLNLETSCCQPLGRYFHGGSSPFRFRDGRGRDLQTLGKRFSLCWEQRLLLPLQWGKRSFVYLATFNSLTQFF